MQTCKLISTNFTSKRLISNPCRKWHILTIFHQTLQVLKLIMLQMFRAPYDLKSGHNDFRKMGFNKSFIFSPGLAEVYFWTPPFIHFKPIWWAITQKKTTNLYWNKKILRNKPILNRTVHSVVHKISITW